MPKNKQDNINPHLSIATYIEERYDNYLEIATKELSKFLNTMERLKNQAELIQESSGSTIPLDKYNAVCTNMHKLVNTILVSHETK